MKSRRRFAALPLSSETVGFTIDNHSIVEAAPRAKSCLQKSSLGRTDSPRMDTSYQSDLMESGSLRQNNVVVKRRTAERYDPYLNLSVYSPIGSQMPHIDRKSRAVAVAILTIVTVIGGRAYAQSVTQSLPNPYHAIENWAKLPEGRIWGAAGGITIDHHAHLWVFERCGGDTCAGRNEAPILEFDHSGKLIRSFGAGMFVFPHAILVDKDDNVWCNRRRREGRKRSTSDEI